jgi:hypothetical protein
MTLFKGLNPREISEQYDVWQSRTLGRSAVINRDLEIFFRETKLIPKILRTPQDFIEQDRLVAQRRVDWKHIVVTSRDRAGSDDVYKGDPNQVFMHTNSLGARYAEGGVRSFIPSPTCNNRDKHGYQGYKEESSEEFLFGSSTSGAALHYMKRDGDWVETIIGASREARNESRRLSVYHGSPGDLAEKYYDSSFLPEDIYDSGFSVLRDYGE